MYILVISRGIPSNKDPQWGCFEKDQAEALAAIGHKVVVISVDGRMRFYWRKLGVTKLCINDIYYFDIFLFPSNVIRSICGGLYYKLKSFQLQYLYRRVLVEFGKPDVIYSHYLLNSYVALDLKNKYDIPLVAIEHWSEINKPILRRDVKKIGSITYNGVDKIISVSESLRQMIFKHFGRDSVVVHNLVGSGFSYIPICPKDTFDFVSVGSLIKIKGYDVLINAFAKMPDINRKRVFIIGDGPERHNLQMMITKLGLGENVFLLGRKGKIEILDVLSKCDVYVSSSHNENFSVSVLEALSIGLPIVATICGGIRECVNDTNGLLVPVNDVDELSFAMMKIQKNIHSYDRVQIAKDFDANFSSESIASKLTDVFKSVVNKNN